MSAEVTGSSFIVGRDDSCDLVLDDAKVSRRHASITPGPGPAFTIRDLGSANGTLVDGVPIRSAVGFTANPDPAMRLLGGETLRFGDTLVVATRDDPSGLVAGTQQSEGD